MNTASNATHPATLLQERQKAAKQKIVDLLYSYPRDTPPEHVIFGYGGVRITFGELQDAFCVSTA